MTPQRTLNRLESKVEQIAAFDPVVIPRLLQTSEYRSAVSATVPTSDIDDDHHAVWARRQPPKVLAIVDECVLHRPPGGLEILRHQLAHLLTATTDSYWSIRVVPRDQTIASGPFTLLRLPDRPPVVVLDHLTCTLFLEGPDDVDAVRRPES